MAKVAKKVAQKPTQKPPRIAIKKQSERITLTHPILIILAFFAEIISYHTSKLTDAKTAKKSFKKKSKK